MDRFPEAFERFEETVDTSRIRSFEELRITFGLWAGQKWHESPKQLLALRIEARNLALRQGRERTRIYPWQLRNILREKTWTYTAFKVKGRIQGRYRDLRTGRFVRKPF